MNRLKRAFSYFVPSFFLLGACFCLFSKSEICASGIKEGLIICAESVIPTLFPFMIISGFAVKSGLGDLSGRIFGRGMGKLFSLPDIAFPVVLMSFIGGYPIGAKMTYELLCEDKISSSDARRMNLFCIGAGPAFIINTVGTHFLSSRKAGIIIFVSTLFASLSVGIIQSLVKKEKHRDRFEKQIVFLTNPVNAFANSVSDSVKAIIGVCSWITVFSCITKYIRSLNGGIAADILCAFLEVTGGIRFSEKTFSLPFIAAIISFGGISVHCQIYSYVSKSGLKIYRFYASRLLCSAVSFLICSLLTKIFPCEIPTFSTASQITAGAYSVSVPTAAALLIMCSVLIFDLETKRNSVNKAVK